MVLCDRSLCNGCSACVNICPKQCITMRADNEGFLQPEINEDLCISCKKCQEVCPVLTPQISDDSYVQECYAAYNKNSVERRKSSSGGIFIVLAKEILKQGGIVFGAAFTNDYKLKHIYIEHESDLHRLLGSKYIQSEIGDSYTNAKEFLKKGRKVLFTGTPCQIVGLNSFLGDSYSNLLTVDFFCHGVPSPEIWNHYLNYRCNKDNNGNLPSNIFFRKKVHGWKNYYTCFDYEKKSYSISHYKDPYMQGFKENLYLRPSCYNCIAKGTNRISDFTVADYWGVQGLCPSMYDNKGTSLVLVNSQKAKTIWGTVSNDLITKKTNLEKASQNNIASIRSVTPHPSRDAFYLRFKHEDFEKIIWDLAPYKPQPRKPLRQRVLSFLRVCYHKLK